MRIRAHALGASMLFASVAHCHTTEPAREVVVMSPPPAVASSATPPVPVAPTLPAVRVCAPVPPAAPSSTSPSAVPNLHALWTQTLSTPPLVVGDSLLAVHHGRLVRITTATGGRTDLGPSPVESLEGACTAGELLVADGPYAAIGLDARTGARRFDVPLVPAFPFRGCTVGEGAVFVVADRDGVGDEEVRALRKSDGAQQWRTPLPPRFTRRPREPIRQDGAIVYVPGDSADRRACLLALDAANGTPKWSTCAGERASFATDETRVVVGDKAGLRILDPSTGALTMQVELPYRDVPSLSVAGDTATVYSNQAGAGGDAFDAVEVMDLAQCTLRWRWVSDQSWAGVGSPVTAGGSVYLSRLSEVVAIDHGAQVESVSTGLFMSLAPAGPVFVGVGDMGDPRVGVRVSAFAASGPPIPEETAIIEGRVLAARCGPVAGLPISVGDATATTDARGHYRLEVTGRGTVDVGGMYRTYPTMSAFRDPANIVTPILVTLTGAGRYHADFAIDMCRGD